MNGKIKAIKIKDTKTWTKFHSRKTQCTQWTTKLTRKFSTIYICLKKISWLFFLKRYKIFNERISFIQKIAFFLGNKKEPSRNNNKKNCVCLYVNLYSNFIWRWNKRQNMKKMFLLIFSFSLSRQQLHYELHLFMDDFFFCFSFACMLKHIYRNWIEYLDT